MVSALGEPSTTTGPQVLGNEATAPEEAVPQAKKKQKTGAKPASNTEQEVKPPPPWKPQSKHSAVPTERVIPPRRCLC